MAITPPYMFSTGLIPKIFEKIQNARRPDRFTQDFLETKLGHSGGSARPIIPLLKRLGFLGSDGAPTPLYDQFRDEATRASAVAQGMKNGFSEFFDRNEYANDLSREKLASLVIGVTGGARGDRKTKAIVGTFMALNAMADFENNVPLGPVEEQTPEVSKPTQIPEALGGGTPEDTVDNVDLNVSYTINLNLPETTNLEVFNAIFEALRNNLLENHAKRRSN